MANGIILKRNGVQVYPRTVTAEVADIKRKETMDIILDRIEKDSQGWSLAKDSDGESYHLLNSKGEVKGTIEIPQETIDTYVESVEYYPSFNYEDKLIAALKFRYLRNSYRYELIVPLDSLTYNQKISFDSSETLELINGIPEVKISKNSKNFLEISQDGLLVDTNIIDWDEF